MSQDTAENKAATKAAEKAAKLAEKQRLKEEKAALKAQAKEEAKAARVRKPRNSMAQSWGAVFTQAATEGHDKAWVEQEMIARHPEKSETVLKWTTWYKNFYNMGRIKGYENPVKVEWPREVNQEVMQKREAKKAEKAAAREVVKQEKLAAKEAMKAQKVAEREAAKEAAKNAAAK